MAGGSAWLWICVTAAACAGRDRIATSETALGGHPGCPRVASIHCESRLDPVGTGSALVTCRAPAGGDDEILVLWRHDAEQPFAMAPVERVSPCEVRASLGKGAEEMYVALVAASGQVLLESAAVRVTALGQLARPSERAAGRWRPGERTSESARDANELPLAAEGPHEESYRGWVILVDLASLATVPFGVGILGALIGAPIVHGAHGNGAAAGKSLLLRVTVPLAVTLGSFLAFRAGSDCESNAEDGCFFEFAGAVLLGGVSLAVVMVIDWALFAKRWVEPTSTWTPTVGAGDDALQLGVQRRW